MNSMLRSGRLMNPADLMAASTSSRRTPPIRLIPCSPNKLLFSDVVSIRPGRRLVLSGFQTVYKSRGAKNLEALDSAR